MLTKNTWNRFAVYKNWIIGITKQYMEAFKWKCMNSIK